MLDWKMLHWWKVGALCVAGTVVVLEASVEVLVNPDGTLWCPLKLFRRSVLSIFAECLEIL